MGKFLIVIKDFYSKYNSKNDDTKQFIESIENFFSFSLFVLFRICLFLLGKYEAYMPYLDIFYAI